MTPEIIDALIELNHEIGVKGRELDDDKIIEYGIVLENYCGRFVKALFEHLDKLVGDINCNEVKGEIVDAVTEAFALGQYIGSGNEVPSILKSVEAKADEPDITNHISYN